MLRGRDRGRRTVSRHCVSHSQEKDNLESNLQILIACSARTTDKLTKKNVKKARKKELVVFIIRRDSKCSDCGKKIERGDLLKLEGDNALCIECADLDHLSFLPSGDAALTRRATKHSRLRAVVVKWSSARKRYERQGIIVEPSAIEQAEEECIADADLRAERRKKAAKLREELDKEFVSHFTQAIRNLYPSCPKEAENEIAEHACMKYSGRIGRSAAAKKLDEQAIHLAVLAHIRHLYTPYDELLMEGLERNDARRKVREHIDEISHKWKHEKGE